jgi:gamma-glutamyl-gamma-aminobutyrate hydrolase PuuD
MTKHKIAIIDDAALYQRLIANFMEFNGAELVVVSKKITASKNAITEEIELHKKKYLAQVRDIIENVDGIVLLGNKNDINPTHYGETFIHPETQKKLNTDTNDIRFHVEKTMRFSAIERQLPIVAICWGMQL